MKKIYKVKKIYLLKAIWFYTVALLFLIWFPFHVNYVYPENGITFIFIIIYGIFIFPIIIYPLIVHLNHYLYDKNAVLIVDTEMGTLYYEKGNITKNMQISDILMFKEYIYMSKGYSLRYYELCFNDNTKFIVTPMLISNLSKTLNINLRQERTDMFNMFL